MDHSDNNNLSDDDPAQATTSFADNLDAPNASEIDDPLAPTPDPLSTETLEEEKPTKDPNALFGPDDFDIYINKITLDAFIFHGQKMEHDIERLDYDWSDQSVSIIKKDGSTLDLGTKIQWLIRPYFRKLREIGVVQTENGEEVDGFFVPIHHLNTEDS